MQHILTVTDTFEIAKRGVLVVPLVPLRLFEGKKVPQSVELRLPDGSIMKVASYFSIPRQNPQPKEFSFGCMLPNIQKSSCPIGTEVWAEIEVETLQIG